MPGETVQKIGSTQIHLPQADNPSMGTVTSSFFVSMDDVFQVSNVGAGDSKNAKELKNAVQLLWHTSIEERPSIGTMTSNFQASATLIHSLLEMHVLTDSAMPMLRQHMRDNTPIKEIKITRVGHLGKDHDNTILYQTIFTRCFLESVEEFPDKLIIKARITTRADTAAATDFTDKPNGKTASGWDYAQNTAMS
ncbi:MAG: hypothetical protein K0R76_528 [Alphaproteobacteria bacterium]|jgi:type VI protein secretion system component Hcp|nr:hypothetical protein [Alphaproteobacteria bacterium]MDF3033574.1 hypothetical protein [Alphaproteobacteria bacterium]